MSAFKSSPTFALSFLALLLSSTAAFAQAVPTSVQPGQVQKTIDQQTMPGNKVSTPEDLTNTKEVQAPPGAEKITFVLHGVNVVGAKQLPQSEIQSTYQNLLGKKISLVQVYEIANNITHLYRDKGYILSRAVVPQQEIGRDGVVKIQIVEGFVSSYRIQGDTRGNERELRAYADKIVGSGALTTKNLERYLLLMNDLPGMTVRSILAPSQTRVGGADMTLVVEQKTVQGLASVDNYGNSFLGPTRLTGSAQFNSLFYSSDQWNATYLTAPISDELRYYGGGFKHNIGSEGTKIGFNSSYTLTDPSLPAALGGALEPEGEAFDFNATVDHPFVRSRSFNLYGGLAFDINKNKTDFAPGLAAIETEDNQRIVRANTQMTYLDNWAGYNTFDASISKGLNIFGGSDKGDANLSRAAGDPQFLKFDADASRLQRIHGPFSGLLAVTGQYSVDPLLASEEFGLGGTDFGRGYDSSEITGDHALAGKAEFIYNGNAAQRYLTDYQVYAFYDIGAVWNKDPAAGQDSRDSLASTGVGTRLSFTPNLRGDAFVAKPLTRPVVSRGTDDGKDLRFKFSVTTNF